jgi:ribulose-5-phosphate 4-epimerase/fuculose-1-phosphate aldolase
MDYKKELVRYARIAEEKRLVNTIEGNLSVLDRQTGLTYITPSRTMKLLLEEEQVSVVDAAGNQVDGSVPRSSEYLLHEAAFRARPDCTACLHSHAPFLSAYAMCEKTVEIPESAGFLGTFKDIPCLPFGMPSTHAIHAGLEEAIQNRQVVLLGRHGAVSVGRDLSAAIGLMEAAEELAKTYFIAKAVGKPKKFEDAVYKTLYQAVMYK